MAVKVARLPIQLAPDSRRVITRLFVPGEENRVRDITERLLSLPEGEVEVLVAKLQNQFQPLHPNIDKIFLKHFDAVKRHIPPAARLTNSRRTLIGACFTMEYAIESAALFNPSMAPAIDQAGVPPGAVRFVMSLRATGEGHVSSIVFRRGIVDAAGRVSIDPPGRFSRPLEAILPDDFDKGQFIRDLQAHGLGTAQTDAVMGRLGDRFTRADLSNAIDAVRTATPATGMAEESIDAMLALSRANYRLDVPPGTDLSEAVIFPYSDNERHGIEDMRLVRFADDDGSIQYFGTYTAYDGYRTYPQLLRLRQGGAIEISMLGGTSAKNKGMALFPRKIRGRYAMIARLDNENLYYMESDDVLSWNDARLLQRPTFSWEVIQIGNCGSPLETPAGWLLLTHGVGPMRQYCIGATLLDLNDPTRIIGQTRQPLLVPTEAERFGYVPNVVYSCGGMIHDRWLILPYAMSDVATSIALVDLEELLASLQG